MRLILRSTTEFLSLNLVVISRLFDGCHQRAPKAKKGKGKALPPPVLEPPQLGPAQEEVNKTTNVKSIH